MSAKSIAKKAFKANAITEEEYKQLLCVIRSSYKSLRQKGVWINAPTVEGEIEILTKEAYSDLCLRASRERPTGKWIPVTNGRGGNECSVCHDYAPSYKSGDEYLSDFCPYCGADMRKEADNE